MVINLTDFPIHYFYLQDKLKAEYESKLRSLERELNDLREALDEERGRNVLEDPDVTEAFAQMRRDHEQDKVNKQVTF